MESEKRINEAKKVLHGLQSRFGKRRARMHVGAADENAQRLRALDGLCGHCPNLKLLFHNQHGKRRVTLDCDKGFDPLGLYEGTPIGSEASCSGFPKKEIK